MVGAVDVAVISPFTRTLQTSQILVGEEGRRLRKHIQPLCAEHTLGEHTVNGSSFGPRGRIGHHEDRCRGGGT